MKKGMAMTGILAMLLILASSFSLRENPQDPPRGSKKHIKLIKEKDGQKMELDTIIEGDKVFVWDGDTIGKAFDMPFEKLKIDSFWKISAKDGKTSLKMVYIKQKDGEPEVYNFSTDGKNNAVWVSVDDDKVQSHSTSVAKVVTAPHIRIKTAENIIDLNDPGIISYEKKKLSGGREKIEIIRNEPDETDVQEFVVKKMKSDEDGGVSSTREVKKVRIFKNEDGVFNILEADSCCIADKDGKGCILIMKSGKDGKVIRIEEVKEGTGKKMKVTAVP